MFLSTFLFDAYVINLPSPSSPARKPPKDGIWKVMLQIDIWQKPLAY
ncbi:hypothetical protein SpAn4DRAFT_0101 [Sporomusa ovata]|uniref:Uncharacterized protein n=1 Tax=Sporomusa ovata TaxID=2378 RepID=A0A0U1L2Q6_9FIRM|nr:hypothetical protein SpAn4DRAFT_0101 [Sporomusa ovata]